MMVIIGSALVLLLAYQVIIFAVEIIIVVLRETRHPRGK